MELVTGRKGSPHITSQQDRMLHQGVFGQGSYILNTGQNLKPQVQTSNEIRIRDGAIMAQGALGCVKVNTYDPVTIQNGSQGMKRIDLICWQYTYDAEQDVESAEWVVIQGTPAESDPQQPAYTGGDIQQGDSPVQVPVFAVELDGINVTGVTTLLQTAPTLEELNSNSYKLHTGILGGISSRPYTLKKYNDGTFELCGNLDLSAVRLQYSNSSKMYFTTISAPIPEELTIDLDKRVQFAGSAENTGIYFLTLNELTTTTLTAYLSAMNYTSEIAYIASGFVLKGWWK